MQPLVTVLMSVHNGEKWLEQSIQSILHQTYSNFEFIIVNDGSIDDTERIIKDFGKIDSRIILINKKNTGLTDSLNFGAGNAKGKWLARIDCDDVSHPERIEKQILIAEASEKIAVVGTGAILINEEGLPISNTIYDYSDNDYKKRLLLGKSIFPHSSALINRSLFTSVGGYRVRMKNAQDHDLWLRIGLVGNIICIKEPLVKIRTHSNQVSQIEGGYNQKIFAHMAHISHQLRKFNFNDPVDASHEHEFSDFHRWVKSKFDKTRTLKSRQLITQLKTVLDERPLTIKNCLYILIKIFNNPRLIFLHIRDRHYFHKINRQLALQWMGIHKILREGK
ncbi:glycosyltransferase [Hydrogenophaga sp.]|uniref:glycosyltransferase n=1 Tax=Hydrogenophaga sp. TaxID=1904254 RepID=UPI0035B2585C